MHYTIRKKQQGERDAGLKTAAARRATTDGEADMAKFIKYLGEAHINEMNVALYDSGSLRVENVVNNKSIGARQFESVSAAEDWFESIGDTNAERTWACIKSIKRADEQESV